MEESRLLKFKDDEIILYQGQKTQEMYKILMGKAALYLNYGKEDEYLIGVLSEQRCFGEVSVLCDQPSVYTVVSIGEVLLLRITEDYFEEFIKNNPNNVVGIMKNLANTLVTLSFNLNMLAKEMSTQEKSGSNTTREILDKIRHFAYIIPDHFPWEIGFDRKV